MPEKHSNTHIDLTLLKANAFGSDEFILKVFDIFLQQMPVLMDTLNAALADQDWSALAFEAHKMRASAEIFGASDLVKKLQKVEHDARTQQHLDQLPEQIAAAQEECHKVIDEVVHERQHYL